MIEASTPPKRKVDPATVVAHGITAIIVALGTLWVNRTPAPPTPVAPVAVVTPATPTTTPPGATVTPAGTTTPPPLPTETVIKATTVRIEAGTVQLMGNVTVSIPEIKPPNVIVENKLPQAVMDALTKPAPAPVVHVQNYIDPASVKLMALPLPQIKSTQTVPDPTTEGEVLPPPRDAVKPPVSVRVLPTISESR